MNYTQLSYVHLATIIPAFFIGTYLLLNRKGTARHRLLGKVYMLLMLVTALVSLFMPAKVGARFLGHFGFIHIFSVFVLYGVPAAYLAARRGDIAAHKGNMIGIYVGGLIIAGALAFMPGRMLHQLIVHIF
jgi:uncharacterized membrane protein